MEGFSGFEPVVGEIRGLRSFRVEESGHLLPLYSDLAWFDGPNTAICSPPARGVGWAPCSRHEAPAPGCDCGFYAVGSAAVARDLGNSRYVLGVVACWGRVVAGTRGFRAQHARLEALWLHPDTPTWIRSQVAAQYPSSRVYADRELMLSEHPPTQLDCYQPEPGAATAPRALLAAAFAVVLALGLVPLRYLTGIALLEGCWIAAMAIVLAGGGYLLATGKVTGRVVALTMTTTLITWLVAPGFGVAGWLLRWPMIRAGLRAGRGAVRTARPHYFPIEPVQHSPISVGHWPTY